MVSPLRYFSSCGYDHGHDATNSEALMAVDFNALNCLDLSMSSRHTCRQLHASLDRARLPNALTELAMNNPFRMPDVFFGILVVRVGPNSV